MQKHTSISRTEQNVVLQTTVYKILLVQLSGQGQQAKATHAVSYTLHNRWIKCLSCLRVQGLLTGAVTEVSWGTGERLPVYFFVFVMHCPPSSVSSHTMHKTQGQ